MTLQTLDHSNGNRQHFGLSSEPMDNDLLRKVCPSLFTSERADHLTDAYKQVRTIDVIEALREENFHPFFAWQTQSRTMEDRMFARHMVRLRRPEDTTNEHAREIAVINGHDGTCRWKSFAGVLKFACTNTALVGFAWGEANVTHTQLAKAGDDPMPLIIASVLEVAKTFNRVEARIDDFRRTKLAKDDQRFLAEEAAKLRFGIDENGKLPLELDIDAMLQRTREEDNGDDLWTVFNVVQEKIMHGGVPAKTNTANGVRNVVTRPVKAVTRDVKLNRALWDVTELVADALQPVEI